MECPPSNLLQEINFAPKYTSSYFPILDVNLRYVAVGVDDVHVGGDGGDVDGGAARHAGVPVRPGVRPGDDTQVAVGHLRISINFKIREKYCHLETLRGLVVGRVGTEVHRELLRLRTFGSVC